MGKGDNSEIGYGARARRRRRRRRSSCYAGDTKEIELKGFEY